MKKKEHTAYKFLMDIMMPDLDVKNQWELDKENELYIGGKKINLYKRKSKNE